MGREELLLTASKALSDPRVAPALAASGVELHEDVALALALLLQPVLHPGGAWAAYMRLLPKRTKPQLVASTSCSERTAQLCHLLRDLRHSCRGAR